MEKNDSDGLYAMVILVVTVVVAIVGGIFLWKKSSASSTTALYQLKPFKKPDEVDVYVKAKRNNATSDELKKLLMRRTIASIPMIQSMQSEGASIERLYKKGILTDDMHYRMNEVKAFLDVEFQEVQTEADFLVPGWGQRIWQEGVQYYQLLQQQVSGSRDGDAAPNLVPSENSDEMPDLAPSTHENEDEQTTKKKTTNKKKGKK